MSPILEDIIRTINFFFWLIVTILAVFFILLSISESRADDFERNNCGLYPASPACRGVERAYSDVPPQTNTSSSRTCVVVGANLYCANTTTNYNQ